MRYALLITIVIITAHIGAFCVLGAGFWADSLVYAALGDALFDPAKLHDFYNGIGSWTFSQLGPGLPVLWWITKLFSLSWRWPFLAAVQHSAAAGSCGLLFVCVMRPSAYSFGGAVLLSFLPFYQAGHQMLMTESLSTSLLLIVVSLTICLVTKRWSEPMFWLILAAMFFVAQFRSYFGLMAAALAFAALAWSGRWRSSRTFALIAAFAVSTLAFPAYRYFITGKFFLPSLGTNALVFATWANPAPSTGLVHAFELADLPLEHPADEVLTKGLDYNAMHLIDEHWRAKGLSDYQIKARANHLAQLLFHDGTRSLINRAVWGLCSCGFLLPYKLGPASYPVIRGGTMASEWRNQVDHYRWLSWTDSPTSYQASFQYIFRTPQPHLPASTVSQKELIALLEPYLKFDTGYFRDPLFLSRVPLDCWFFLGITGIALLCVCDRAKVAILLAVPIAVNFAALACVVPGVRYAYALVPIYICAGVLGLEALRSKLGGDAGPPPDSIRSSSVP